MTDFFPLAQLLIVRLHGMEPSPRPSWIVAGVESSRPLPSPSRTSSCGRSRRSKLLGPPSFLTGNNQPGDGFWSKVLTKFLAMMDQGPYRDIDSVSSKW
ncbi:uncharacterized protein LOC110909218 isoform X2 [Helianthus annuus]|uniref:uncharacterized protein LOC110909218 isoform X2 n=1 Tax=Helianthus annuus TaxID=4232 RepID=UPI00165305C9|nr:uncharacterized protein LOC110909218 isoform X2 [Helianthus annuus]